MHLPPKRNYGCRVHEAEMAGMRALVLQNKTLRVTILLDKGADIIEFLHKPSDTDWMGISPLGLRNPRDLQKSTSGRKGSFIDSYEGGWQDIFPNGGDACHVQGVDYGQHGEAVLCSWDYTVISDLPERITLKLYTSTQLTPFMLVKTLTLEDQKSSLMIEEKITNLGVESIPIMWGQHPAFGAPALNSNCKVILPECKVHSLEGVINTTPNTLGPSSDWPYAPDTGIDLSSVLPEYTRQERMYFLSGFKEGWYGIYDTHQGTGFGLGWCTDTYPYLWYWHINGNLGSPWFGKVYLMALEPFSSPVPQLNRALDQGWAVSLGAGETIEAWVTAVATSGQVIQKVERDGSIL